MRAGSASGRRSPADGERRLISAIAPSPGRRSASSKRPIRQTPARTPRAPRAAPPPSPESSVVRGDLEPLAQVVARARPRRCPPAAFSSTASRFGPRSSPARIAADLRGVLLRAAAGERRRVGRLDPELARVDHAVAHVAVDDLGHQVRPARRELVDPAEAVHDERAARAELRQRVGDRPHERRPSRRRRRPRARPAGLVERAEHVEDRARPELPPHRRGVAHRRMVRRGEHEAEAEVVDRLGDPLGRLLEGEAERLEHVGRAGRRAHGPVPVLRDGARRPRRRRSRRRSRC